MMKWENAKFTDAFIRSNEEIERVFFILSDAKIVKCQNFSLIHLRDLMKKLQNVEFTMHL